MAAASNVQTSFLGGEWAPMAQGQMSHPRYGTALARCLNSIPTEEHSCGRRPGFRQIGPTRRTRYGRLLEFPYADRAPFLLEFTKGSTDAASGFLNILSGTERLTDSSAIVSSISAASPASMVLTSSPGWAAGDSIVFEFDTDDQACDASILGNRVFRLLSGSGTTFTLGEDLPGETTSNFDGALVTAVNSGELVAKRILSFATSYGVNEIPTLRSVQTQGTAILLQGTVTPHQLDYSPVTDAFTLSAAQLLDGPYLDPVSGSIATPNAVTGHISLTLSFAAYSATKAYKKGDYVLSSGIGYRALVGNNLNKTPASNIGTYWETASPGEAVGPNGFTSADIGRSVRMFSAGTTWTWGRITALSTTGAISGTLSGSTNIGDLTGNGGLAALFDSDNTTGGTTGSTFVHSCYGGKNYSGASAQTISSVIVMPPNVPGTLGTNFDFETGQPATTLTFNLRAKSTLPANAADGTLLGTASASSLQTTPVTINSNDAATTWNYVWVEIVAANIRKIVVGDIQFYGSGGIAGTSVTVEVLGPDLAGTAAMTVWRLGVYGGENGYPTAGCYAFGRLWLASAIANRVDASKSNDIFNFEPTNGAGTVADNNAISAVFNSAKSNKIYWLRPELYGIVCGTDGGEFLLRPASSNTGISPTNIEAPLVSAYKCANIEPVRTPSTVLFVQKHKRKLQEYMADPQQNGKFFAPNMSKFAKHLTVNQLAELAYQEELSPIAWARTGAGDLVGCTYRRTSVYSAEDPEFFGWHRHTLGSERKIISVAIGASEDGLTDTLYVVSHDSVSDAHFIEYLTPIPTDDDTLFTAQNLDASLVPPGATIAGGSVIVGGLAAHESKRVDAWIAGLDCGTYPVVNGTITVPYQSDPGQLLTHKYLQDLTTNGEDYGSLAVPIDSGMLRVPMVVGFAYSSEGQLLPPVSPQSAGSQNGPAFAKTQRNHQYGVKLLNTQGIEIGTDFDRAIKPCNFRENKTRALAKNELFTGVHSDSIGDSYTFESQLCWRVQRPYPAFVLALGGFIHTQDR